MFKALKQARAAFSLLNPSEVRQQADRTLSVVLHASSSAGYAAMEDFLMPAGVPHGRRLQLMESVHRAVDADAPAKPDIVLCDDERYCPSGGFVLRPDDPSPAIHEIMRERGELSLALARNFPLFRKPVIDGIVLAVSRENAMFAVATSLPNILPSFLELPWSVGEFASDTAFLTMNQVRMAFVIAAASGKPVGPAQQKAEIGSIVASAFGWRAIARELVGKIPLGGGLIPKGAIAFAATWLVGKGLEKLHAGVAFNHNDRKLTYAEGLENGRKIVGEALNS